MSQKIRETKQGSRLYSYWQRVKRKGASKEFDTFLKFYKWAMKNDYEVGKKLLKYDQDEPYGPDNCFWVSRDKVVETAKSVKPQETPNCKYEREAEWDEVVNRIRLHYGMKPIHSSEV